MARSLRDIRRKIKAVKSTRQITKAMELVAASKMRKAVSAAQSLRMYARMAWDILERLANINTAAHPYMQERPVKKILGILFTSDKGLCGPLNAQLFRKVLQYQRSLEAMEAKPEIEFIAVGKKGGEFIHRTGKKVIASFPAFTRHASFKEIFPISRLALNEFFAGTYDHVVLLYSDFVSPLVQIPTAKKLLPLSKTDLSAMINSLNQGQKTEQKENMPETKEYLFEPSQDEVLETILPQLTEIQVYQGMLEATASEHSARMVAMQNATTNASEIIGDLTLTYNQTRQSAITAELAEISASKAALE